MVAAVKDLLIDLREAAAPVVPSFVYHPVRGDYEALGYLRADQIIDAAKVLLGGRLRAEPPQLEQAGEGDSSQGSDPLAVLKDWLRVVYAQADVEYLLATSFSDSGKLIAVHKLAVGTRWAVPMSLPRLIRLSCLDRAADVILVHNHLTADSTVSDGDISATRDVENALRQCQLRLYDHWIVAGDEVTSMRDLGHLTGGGEPDGSRLTFTGARDDE